MKFILSALSLIFFISCGQDYAPSGEQASLELTNSEAIIDGVDWTPLRNIKRSSKIYQNGQKVGLLSIVETDGIFNCTAFNIGKNHIMTNNHCVPNAQSATFILYKIGDDTYDCSEFALGNASLDYTVLKCEGDLDQKHGKLSLSRDRVSILSDSIYTIHHNCNYLTDSDCDSELLVSPGAIWKTLLGYIKHNSDTLKGSSGAAIFDFETNKVLALHNIGYGAQDDGEYNMANEMRKIVTNILVRKPSILR